MAKGLRASNKKANRSKLRKNVFGPVEAARNERLSAKLLELAQQSKPARNNDMELDSEKELATTNTDKASTAGEEESTHQQAEDMDVDGAQTAQTSSASRKSSKKSAKIQKKRHRKARNEIAFKKVTVGKRTRGGPGRTLR